MAVGSGTQLVELLGVSMLDGRIDELLQELGTAQPEYVTDEACDVTSPEHGLALRFS